MTSDGFVDALLERGYVELAGDAERHAHVVGDAARFELVQEPQAFLCEGERGLFVRWASRNHVRRSTLTLFQEFVELLSLQRRETGSSRAEFRSSVCKPIADHWICFAYLSTDCL